jgi:hypothetical protein
MQKPKDYDNVQIYDYEPLKLGGHVCKILKVEETKSSTGKDMVKVYLDIAEGEQKDYFKKKFENDTRKDKKWGCVVNVVVQNKEGNTSTPFKRFITSVERSNGGFTVKWGEDFEPQFKGKIVGGVFGREEYLNDNKESRFVIKCRYFTTVDRAKKGIKPPKDYLLQKKSTFPGYEPTQEDESDDLPF